MILFIPSQIEMSSLLVANSKSVQRYFLYSQKSFSGQSAKDLGS